MPNKPTLQDAQEMLEIAGLQLVDIHFDRLSIETTASSTQPKDTGDASGMRLDVDCSLATRQEGKQFGARFEFLIKAADWTAGIAAITEYAGSQEFELSKEAPFDFASRVALMAAFPYVREALADLTTRVTGSAVLLPLIRLGELSFQPNQ